MNDATKSIIETMGGSCPDECPYEVGCSGCECKCTLVAERIYTTHVKPLEDALGRVGELMSEEKQHGLTWTTEPPKELVEF